MSRHKEVARLKEVEGFNTVNQIKSMAMSWEISEM